MGACRLLVNTIIPLASPVPLCLLLNRATCRYTGNRRAFSPSLLRRRDFAGVRAKTEWATPETGFFLVLKEQTDCTRKSAHHRAAVFRLQIQVCRLQIQFFTSCSLLLLILCFWLRVLLQLYFSVRRRRAVQVISLRLSRRRRVRTERNISRHLIDLRLCEQRGSGQTKGQVDWAASSLHNPGSSVRQGWILRYWCHFKSKILQIISQTSAEKLCMFKCHKQTAVKTLPGEIKWNAPSILFQFELLAELSPPIVQRQGDETPVHYRAT